MRNKFVYISLSIQHRPVRILPGAPFSIDIPTVYGDPEADPYGDSALAGDLNIYVPNLVETPTVHGVNF